MEAAWTLINQKTGDGGSMGTHKPEDRRWRQHRHSKTRRLEMEAAWTITKQKTEYAGSMDTHKLEGWKRRQNGHS